MHIHCTLSNIKMLYLLFKDRLRRRNRPGRQPIASVDLEQKMRMRTPREFAIKLKAKSGESRSFQDPR
jgi:hypothetical protein